jgi:hypothetical protein
MVWMGMFVGGAVDCGTTVMMMVFDGEGGEARQVSSYTLTAEYPPQVSVVTVLQATLQYDSAILLLAGLSLLSHQQSEASAFPLIR